MPSYCFLTHPTSRQLSSITSLYREADWWSKSESDDPDLVKRIISGSHFFAVATIEDEIIAMGRTISDQASDAYIQDVTVTKKYQGNGIGAEIIKMLIRGLRQDNIYWIALIAERFSHPFYEKLGFTVMPNSTPMLWTVDADDHDF